jgi:transposase
VRSLLPPAAATGRPPRDARTVLAGVLWILGSHASWRELPAEYGPWQTVYRRYRDWCATGLWPRLLQALRSSEPQQSEVSL